MKVAIKGPQESKTKVKGGRGRKGRRVVVVVGGWGGRRLGLELTNGERNSEHDSLISTNICPDLSARVV